MKKFMSVALSASMGALLLTTAVTTSATARPWSGGHYYRHGNDGAWLGAGLGIFALAAILASQHHDRYQDRADYRDVPPPPPPRSDNRYDNGPGYGQGYDRGYDNGGYDR